MKWHFSAFLLLLFGAAHHLLVVSAEKYTGPVFCKGNKPLIIRDEAVYEDDNQSKEDGKKQLDELYWYQFYNHFHGCQIVMGNLIMPHQHGVPFEYDRLHEAIKDIMIVTGYIYIYDVSLDLNFTNLRMVYGNEVFKLPAEWNKEDNNVGANHTLRTAEHAIFVEKFTGENILMPELRYIKRGRIGFLDTPKACAWFPEKRNLDFSQFFDYSSTNLAPVNYVNSFTECSGPKIACKKVNETRMHCEHCYGETEDLCQPVPRTCTKNCPLSDDVRFCGSIPFNNARKCCADNSYGGCDFETAEPFHCRNGYFLVIDVKGLKNATRTCETECHGLVINGTSICLKNSEVCPDYMFPYLGKYCAYDCPGGFEMDPIGNFELIDDVERKNFKYTKYWAGQNSCKRCRVTFDTVKRDFVEDCGAHCVIPSNSLSFFTILNIYPAATEIADMDFLKFSKIFHGLEVNYSESIFAKKCRHIFGFLHIDQYSVGYPSSGRRLIPEHLKPLTYATGLYGNIRIENTEGYWFAEPFRNLLVIQKPIKGKLPVDTEQFHGSKSKPVTVRYNSDLRTVDLQRLQYVWGDIEVQHNPLYIPPVPPNEQKVFSHIEKTSNPKSNVSTAVGENVSENGLDITRTGRKITYDSGCKPPDEDDDKPGISYYYKRCVKCAKDELREFVEDNHEYYARCKPMDTCDIGYKNDTNGGPSSQTTGGFFVAKRDGEQVCLKCSETCKYSCKDTSAFNCFNPLKPGELSCQGRKVDSFNMEACLTVDNSEECPGPFYGEGNKCKRCKSECKLCSGDSDKYSWPGTNNVKGCKTCGVVYTKYDKDANKYTTACAGNGPEPRCAPGTDCHYFTTNPVRDSWENMERATSDEFNEYGEQISS